MRLLRFSLGVLFSLMALLVPRYAESQENHADVQQLIADIVEDLSSKSESEEDYSQLIEDLLAISQDPISINLATADDLKKLFFLSDFQISSLIEYRDSTGSILSIYELQTIPGFDIIDIRRVEPFVKIEQVDKTQLNSMLYGRNELTFRYRTSMETPAGYKNSYSGSSKYLGDKNAYYTRYGYRGGKHLQLGFVSEKDAGEPFFDGTFKTGFDYISGYVLLTKVGAVKKLIVGDYHAEFGQGLTFWNSLSFGKSSNVLSVRKRADGLVKHSSAYESQFMRGAGVTLSMFKTDFTVFASYKNIDASITDTLDNGDLAFSSLPETGYHRNSGEIDGRNALPEFTAGANITYSTKRVKAGLTFAHSRIDGTFAGVQSIYDLWPTPTEKTAVGLSADVSIKQHQFFGEVAADLPNGYFASVAGGLFRLSNTVQVSILGRSYSRNFNPRYTAGFAEGSGTCNENGIYTGISILPTKGWRLSGYIDLFKFPWLRYAVNAPSSGREFMALSEHSINSDFALNVRYRYKQVEKNMSDASTPTVPVINQTNQNVRLQVNFRAAEGVALKAILESAMFDTDSASEEYGYLLAQDVNVTLPKLPVTISCRFAIFDTPSWSTRIYSYESDMLYSFSVPAYYLKGTRVFALVKYNPKPWIDIWVRYAQTYYSDMDEIGQGADLISGNIRSEVKAMVRVKF